MPWLASETWAASCLTKLISMSKALACCSGLPNISKKQIPICSIATINGIGNVAKETVQGTFNVGKETINTGKKVGKVVKDTVKKSN